MITVVQAEEMKSEQQSSQYQLLILCNNKWLFLINAQQQLQTTIITYYIIEWSIGIYTAIKNYCNYKIMTQGLI